MIIFYFHRQKKKHYALKKPKNSLGKKVKKIKTKKDLDKNTGIKTRGAEVLLLSRKDSVPVQCELHTI